MANGLALSTSKRGEIYVGNGIGHSLPLLDVLYANQFETENQDQEYFDQTEENFYRGAPPNWLNFHVSEEAESDGTGTPFIKRDGYDGLVEQIHQKKKHTGISTVKLFHQPGCGGTTLAMQVLWDLRKTFRSAVLTGSTSDITKVAANVVHLYTAGSRHNHNTVLLLVNDEQNLENLQDSIRTIIAEQNIVTHVPVVILLNCIRKDAVPKSDWVILQKELSDTEKNKFNEKKEELSRRYSGKYKQFHGFNIMQTNFSQAYIREVCSVFKTIKKAKKPRKTQLAGFLSLLNAYVPGSYLLKSQCMDFFKHDDYNHGDFSLEDRMQPFSHLIITFQQDMSSQEKVCMAHPMIAQCCTELMAESGVTRSDTTRNFLRFLSGHEASPFLLGFVKDMLTKRGPKPVETKKEENPISSTEIKEEQERFSRLILDIQKIEGSRQSASVLKVASNVFDKNPFFPQALARFYYIELKHYSLAEMWAERAKLRDPTNSFIADTLGQVHKNHLKNIARTAKPRQILQLAGKAIEAFKDEERLAENELGKDMKGDGNTKVSHVFNNRGQFGYLQVCNLVYDQLVSQNYTWRGVLTKHVSLGTVLESLGDNKLYRFYDLINSLRDEVERKCAFFDKYLTYSKPDVKKDDPSYISTDITKCHRSYVGDSPPRHLKQQGADVIQKLKQKWADTFAGVFSCLDKECTESELKEITTWWEEIFLCKDSLTALVNYILAHIMLMNMGVMIQITMADFDCKHLTVLEEKMPLTSENSPELHMLALLLYWPTDSDDKSDLRQMIQNMHRSYEHAYKTYLRSRYLRPLFFMGNGQDLNRIVHRKVLEGLFLEQNKEMIQDWSDERIFQDPKVQAHLLKVQGEIRNYRVYATVGGAVIEVDANQRNSLWKKSQVSFYLGFTIKGPVAFSIQKKPAEDVKPNLSAGTDTTRGLSERVEPGACDDVKDSSDKRVDDSDIPLMRESNGNTVFIHKGDYQNQSPAHEQASMAASGHHFVDRHRTALIDKVSDTESILDKLLEKHLITKETYDAVRAIPTTQDQMREILKFVTTSTRGKDALYEILKRMKSMRPLVAELEESG